MPYSQQKNDRYNHSLKIRRIVGLDTCWGSVGRFMFGWFPRVREHMPFGFGSMEDVLDWTRNNNVYDVYSLDIFDTVLRRRVHPPDLIKQLVSEYISAVLADHRIIVSPQEVQNRRIEAERSLELEAVKQGKDSGCHLDNVIDRVIKSLGAETMLDPATIVDYELQLEMKATEPMPGVVSLIHGIRSSGKRVVGTSETYLSTDQLAAILEHNGLLQYFDKLYASSDLGISKITGRLFQHILRSEGNAIVHIGDNYIYDYYTPANMGMKALWFHSRKELKRKKNLIQLHHSGNVMSYVGAVVHTTSPDKEEPLYRLGYEVIGPMITVFIHNVIGLAIRDDIQRIFFVARDGYIMKKIYDTLRSDLYYDHSLPESRYLCLSRFPVRAASLVRFDANLASETYQFGKLFRDRAMTLGDLLLSHGLQPDDFSAVTNKYGVDICGPINDPAQDSNLIQLFESVEFQEEVKRQCDEAKELLRDYLKSTGFIGGGTVAMVDGNSEGITKALLERTYKQDGDYPRTQGYYFTMLAVHEGSAGLDLSAVEGVVGDWRRDYPEELGILVLLGMFIEVFGHPNHGITVGYKRIDSKVIPEFRRTLQEDQYVQTSQCLRGALSYAKDYCRYYSLHNTPYKELLEDMKKTISNWVKSPPKRDADAMKGLFVLYDWPQESQRFLVNEISILDMITVKSMIKKQRSALWTQGTLALAPFPKSGFVYSKIAIWRHEAQKLSMVFRKN